MKFKAIEERCLQDYNDTVQKFLDEGWIQSGSYVYYKPREGVRDGGPVYFSEFILEENKAYTKQTE